MVRSIFDIKFFCIHLDSKTLIITQNSHLHYVFLQFLFCQTSMSAVEPTFLLSFDKPFTPLKIVCFSHKLLYIQFHHFKDFGFHSQAWTNFTLILCWKHCSPIFVTSYPTLHQLNHNSSALARSVHYYVEYRHVHIGGSPRHRSQIGSRFAVLLDLSFVRPRIVSTARTLGPWVRIPFGTWMYSHCFRLCWSV
jgi:hypothetical protein